MRTILLILALLCSAPVYAGTIYPREAPPSQDARFDRLREWARTGVSTNVECPLLHDWLDVTNFQMASDGSNIKVSADLSVFKGDRNPVDYYTCHPDSATEAWVFGGFIVDENDVVHYLGSAECTDSLLVTDHDGDFVTLSPLTLTPSRFEFRFPGQAIAPGQHFRYYVSFEEVWTGAPGHCWLPFSGTFDRIDTTPIARMSLGQLKARWAR